MLISEFEKYINIEKDRLSQFKIETDRAFNKYTLFGSAASLTIIVNLVVKNRSAFAQQQYMEQAIWSFGASLLLSGLCLVLNARLADISLNNLFRGLGFLTAYRSGEDPSERLCDEGLEKFNEITIKSNNFVKYSYWVMNTTQAFAGIAFAVGLVLVLADLGRFM